MAISKRLRFEILRRDGFKCRYCGTTASERELRVDHVTPVALGGTDDPSNLVASCHPCNSGKSATTPDAPLVAGVADDALRWAAAMQAGIAKVTADHGAEMAYRGQFEKNWNRWTIGGKPVPMDSNWRQGAETFRVRGLPVELLVDATDKAMGAKHIAADSKYRYACGIAWKRVEEITAAAKEAFDAATEDDEDEFEDDDEWDEARYFASWLDGWRSTSPVLPSLEEQDYPTFSEHVAAALGAGYEPDSIGYAAHRAGQAHTARVADFLPSANDVLRSRREWAQRRAGLAAAATELWLVEFATASSGDRPAGRDVEAFTEHVASAVGWGGGENVLQAAQLAGTELNYTIDRYLPPTSEVPF